MKHNIELKGFEATGEVQKLVDRLIERVGERTRNFSPDEVFLRLAIGFDSPRKRYHISLTLEVPGKTLAAKLDTHDLEAGLHRTFTEIENQLGDHKAALRGERLWKRLARRNELRQAKGQSPSPDAGDHEAIFQLIRPHLERLSDFVSHELAYVEANGDLAPGELTTDDVVDAVVLRAYDELAKDPARGDLRRWLLQLALQQIESEVKRLKRDHRKTVSLEQGIPLTPAAEEVTRLGEEILEFYQPDEVLKMEDIVPDLQVPSPEQELETKELRQCVTSAVESLPKQWRRVVLLRYVKGSPTMNWWRRWVCRSGK